MNTPTASEIHNYGQIRSIALPPDWKERQPQSSGISTTRQFHPPSDTSSGLYVFYRGCPVSPHSAANFAAILSADPHELNSDEWWQVQEVVRDAALPGAFNLNFARTMDWNNRRILYAGGNWPQSEQQSLTIYIPADEICSQIQEVIYLAPQTRYLDYWTEVERSLQSIQWI
jgi:hypothetical protein